MHLTAPIGQRKVLKCIGSLFYGDSFLGAIVDFTNRNAATRQLADTSVQELKGYYAVCLLIETNFKDRIHTAWEDHNDKTWLLAMPGILRVFTRSRYHQITKFLHYCDERDMCQPVTIQCTTSCTRFASSLTTSVNALPRSLRRTNKSLSMSA